MHDIHVTIAHHTVSVNAGYAPVVAGTSEHYRLVPSFDAEWNGLNKRVTYDGNVLFTRSQDDPDWLEIPWEAIAEPGVLKLGFVGTDQNGVEIVRTVMSGSGIRVYEPSNDMGSDTRAAVADIAAQAKARLDALSEAIPQVESMFQASQAQHQASFDQAQQHRASQFSAKMVEFQHEVDLAVENAGGATDDATEAAEAALNAADLATAAAERISDPDGLAEIIGYRPTRDVHLWTDQDVIVLFNEKDAEDPHILTYDEIKALVEEESNNVYLTNGYYSFHSKYIYRPAISHRDEGAIGFIGSTQLDGEVYSYRVAINANNEVTADEIQLAKKGDVKAYVDSKFLVVDEMPASPVDGLIYFVRM